MAKIKKISKKKSSALPIALGVGAVALLLLIGKDAFAKDKSLQGPGPGPTPTPTPTPKPSPFPAGSALATVIPNALGGINARNEPKSGQFGIPASPIITENTAFNGTTIAVLQTGFKEEGAPANSPIEWWKIMTPTGGIGFVRAVGPQGESNFQHTGDIPLPKPVVAGMFSPMFYYPQY